MIRTLVCLLLMPIGSVALAQQPLTPTPSTRPSMQRTAAQRSAEETLPDEPIPVDATSGAAAILPAATTQPLVREGSLFLDRVGRMTRQADGKTWEFTLDSDGRTMSDPPLILLPNRKLSQLEDLINNS